MSTKKEAITAGRKARKHHSPVKRSRHNAKVELQRELREVEGD
jgi:hypothetical protein